MAAIFNTVLVALILLHSLADCWEFHILQHHPPPGEDGVSDSQGASVEDKEDADVFMDTEEDDVLSKLHQDAPSPTASGSHHKWYFRWHQESASPYGQRSGQTYRSKTNLRQPYSPLKPGQDSDSQDSKFLYPDDTQQKQKWPDNVEQKPEQQPDPWALQPDSSLPGGRSDILPSGSRTGEGRPASGPSWPPEDPFEQKEVDFQSPDDPAYPFPVDQPPDDRLYGSRRPSHRQQPDSGYRPQWTAKDLHQTPVQIPDASSSTAHQIPSPVYPGRQKPDRDWPDKKPDTDWPDKKPDTDSSWSSTGTRVQPWPPDDETKRDQEPDEVTEPGPSQYGGRGGGNWHLTVRGQQYPYPDTGSRTNPKEPSDPNAADQKPPDSWPIDEDDDSGLSSWGSRDPYPTRSPQTGGHRPQSSSGSQDSFGNTNQESKPSVSWSRGASEAGRWPVTDDRQPEITAPRYPAYPLAPPERSDPNETPQAEDCPEDTPAGGSTAYGQRLRPSSGGFGFSKTRGSHARGTTDTSPSGSRGSPSVGQESMQSHCCIQGRDVAVQEHDPQTENIFSFCGKKSKEISKKLPFSCQWMFYKCCENTALRLFYLNHLRSIGGGSQVKGGFSRTKG